MDNLQKKFEEEAMQFLNLCSKTDIRILVGKFKKTKMPDYVRLSCIALVFGYKQVFLKITQTVEDNMEEFLARHDAIDGNFHQIALWVDEFIAGIEIAPIRDLCLEFWAERKAELDKPNFSVKSML